AAVEADPAEQALHEALAFAQGPQRIERARRQQAEIAGVLRDRRVRQPADHAVEQVRGAALEQAFASALGAGAIDIVVAFAPALDETRDQLRRILAVGIQDQRRALLHQVEAGGERGLLAEV